jgi:hypothetical protein
MTCHAPMSCEDLIGTPVYICRAGKIVAEKS